jgi:hypothetical protein
MAKSVGFGVGEFKYKDRFKLGKHGMVLVGEIVQGAIAPRMLLEIGSTSIPILGVEGYNGSHEIGLLFLASSIEDGYKVEVCLVPDRNFFIRQTVLLAKSREESTFDLTAELLSAAVSSVEEIKAYSCL